MSWTTFLGHRRTRPLPRDTRLIQWLRPVLFVLFFLTSTIVAIPLHLNLVVTRRILASTLTRLVDRELVGSVDLGRIDRLDAETVWLSGLAVYDGQFRRVVTIERLHARMRTYRALWDLFTSSGKLTIVVDSVWAEGVTVRLLPTTGASSPSLVEAFRLEPSRISATAKDGSRPYRIALPQVRLGRVAIDNRLPSLPFSRAEFKQLAGLVLVTPEGAAVNVNQFGMKLSDVLDSELTAISSLEFRTPDHVSGQFNANLGSLPLSGKVDYHGEQLELFLDAPKIAPEAAKSLYPSWPITKPLSLSLRTQGPLSALATTLTATVEQSSLELVGTSHVGSKLSCEYGLSGAHLDLSALFGPAVKSDFNLRARVSMEMLGGRPEFSFDGLVESGTLLGQTTPVLDFDGKQDAQGLIFSLRSRDPAVPLRAGLWMRDDRLELDTQIARLALPELLERFDIRGLEGTASLRARARLQGDTLEVEASSTIDAVKFAQLSAARLRLETKFSGPATNYRQWRGSLQATAEQSRVSTVSLPSLKLNAQGTPQRMQVQLAATGAKNSELALESELVPRGEQGVELTHTRATLSSGERGLKLAIGRAALGPGLVEVTELVADGTVGRLQGSVVVRERGVLANVDVERFDLGRLGELLGLPSGQVAGNVSAQLELDASNLEHAQGKSQLVFEDITLGPLKHLTGRLEHTLSDGELRGHLLAKSSLLEGLQGEYRLTLAGPIDRAHSYYDAIGRAELSLDKVHLAELTASLGGSSLPVTTQGDLSCRVTLERNSGMPLPNLTVTATTEGLSLHVARKDQTKLSLERAAVLGSIAYDGSSGELDGAWVLTQSERPRAELGFKSQIDLLDLVARPASALGRLYELPFDAWVKVPEQSLTELEPIVGGPLGSGNVKSTLWLKGPLTDPHLVVDFSGENLTLSSLQNPVPLDAQALVEIAHREGSIRATAGLGSGGKTWATLNASGNLLTTTENTQSADRGPSRGWSYDWSGNVELGLTNLPLRALPFASSSRLDGTLRGGAILSRHDGMSHIDALIPIDNLMIRERPFGQSLFSIQSNDEALAVTAKLIDGGATVDLTATLPVLMTPPLPVPRRERPAHFSVHASGYDAGILAPFLGDQLSHLEGEMSGDLEATFQPEVDGHPSQFAIGGTVELHHGGAHVRALGVNVTNVELTARANSTGSRTLIHVPNVKANIGSGSPNVEATLVLELERLELKRLGASITRATLVPLTVDGVTLAELTGHANLEMVPKPADASSTVDGYQIDVTVGELDVRLPREQSRDVIALTENADIAVVQPLSHTAYQRAQRASTTPLSVRLDLGSKTRVMSSELLLPISGTPHLEYSDKLRPSGAVQLEAGGHIQLMGRTFVIERGQITLEPEEASNPRFEVVAEWRGPTHLVTATVTGTPKEATLHLTSDPALSNESQVLALLLSGSGADVDTAQAGIGVGASLFKEFVSETPLSSLELRTSQDEQHANYTAAVPIQENLWFEGTYQNATSGSLHPTATTSREGFSGTVDWRFHRNWSLRTEVGTLGAGADLLWQYRY